MKTMLHILWMLEDYKQRNTSMALFVRLRIHQMLQLLKDKTLFKTLCLWHANTGKPVVRLLF